MLAECIATAQVDIDMLAPWLSGWLAQPQDGVDLDGAAATLEAVDALATVDIELLTPERLTRRTATTRGVAQPKSESGKSRFGAAAIIDWTVVVDDTPVDEALLERAAASGAGLINVNGRWVRLDRTEAGGALWPISPNIGRSTANCRRSSCCGSQPSWPPRTRHRSSKTSRRRSPPPAGSAICCRACPTRR